MIKYTLELGLGPGLHTFYNPEETYKMSIPLNGWSPEAWNPFVPALNRLGAMIYLEQNPSSDMLTAAIGKTSNARLFEQNVAKFLEVTGWTIEMVAERVRRIESELGLMGPVPFMSLRRGIVDPKSFEGVAILSAGTANYTETCIKDLMLQAQAGARFTCIILLASTRIMDGVADEKHPWMNGLRVVNDPVTEIVFQRHATFRYGLDLIGDIGYTNLPLGIGEPTDKYPAGKPLSLTQQLQHLVKSGQYAELVGDAPVYFPVNFNGLYTALSALSALPVDDIYTSQNAGTLIDELPEFWAPTLQHTLTYPSGTLRLWKKLLDAGMIDYSLINN